MARQDWDEPAGDPGQRHAPDRAAADPRRRRARSCCRSRSRASSTSAAQFDAESTDQVAEALFWFSFSLPFSGFNLLLTRTFFSLQRPWTPTALAGVTLVINIVVAAALYEPLGIGGVVLGTVVATAADDGRPGATSSAVASAACSSRPRRATTRKIVAASAVLGGVAYGAGALLDDALGDQASPRRSIAVGGALALGSAVYAALVLAMRIPEARQIRELFTRRLRRS